MLHVAFYLLFPTNNLQGPTSLLFLKVYSLIVSSEVPFLLFPANSPSSTQQEVTRKENWKGRVFLIKQKSETECVHGLHHLHCPSSQCKCDLPEARALGC